MRSISLFSVLVLILVTVLVPSCDEKEYINSPEYHLEPGELVEIYFSINSCCECCILNLDELEHISYQEEKTVVPYPKGCDGCNSTSAFVFKAMTSGTDTVYLNIREASASCYEVIDEPEMFVIHVE